MALFKVNRGNSSSLPSQMTDGWAYFCTDTAEFFIDYADENDALHRKKINADDIADLTSRLDELTDETRSCIVDVSVSGRYLTYTFVDGSSGRTSIIGKSGTSENSEIFNDYTNNSAVGKYSHAEGFKTATGNYAAHAEGGETQANGQYSHAEGYKTTADEDCSHAEGSVTIASGNASHAEGQGSVASGQCAHAEGYNATAMGLVSHAEGRGSNDVPADITSSTSDSTIISTWETTKFNLAKGPQSHTEGENTLALDHSDHAEGYCTIASGGFSHSEGYQTRATGTSSHAEGYNATATGAYSHVEGESTIASGEHQHVQGRYNVADATSEYAHIVGNGTRNARSNAHTVDWDGNAWFAGDVYVGGSSQNDADKLVKESDVDGKYLPITGGKLSGNLMVDSGAASAISLFSPANSDGEKGYGQIYKNASATADYGLQLRDYTYGETGKSCALVVTNNKTNVSDMLLFANQVDGGSNTYYKIYGEHNKPLPADIGAATSAHEHERYVDSLVTYYGAPTGMTPDNLLVPSALVVANSETNVDLYNVIGGSFAYVFTAFYGSVSLTSRRMQVAMSYNSSSPRMAIRHYAANGWTAWARLVTTTELNTAVANVKAACLPKVTSITLKESHWVFSANAYYQDVALSCVTKTSKVDLQPTYYQLAEWQTDGLAFSTAVSTDGVVRVWVSDVTPKEDITIQVTVQEVLEV